jgi:multiple sugar transport system ATP-binding protein
LGSESYLYCTVRGHDDVQVVARTEGLSSAVRGDLVSLVPEPSTTHLFDTATGARLPSD